MRSPAPARERVRGQRPYERKAREIIQSIRLTEAYPGTAGKQAIMESYLNNNFYGNRSYGVAAAAQSYWKKDLKDLTLAQYALLAGIPKSPTDYDLVQNAVEEEYTDENGKVQTRLVVPQNAQVVRRRNQILELMKTRTDLLAAARTRTRTSRRPRSSPSSSPSRARTRGARRTSCGRCARSSASCCAASPSARRSTPAATR